SSDLDFSAISGYSLYEDNRVKFIDPEIRQYPFTVEYSCELGMNGVLSYPPWFPLSDHNISAEKCNLRVTIPKGIELRYYERNLPVTVKVTSDEVNNIYQWEISNLKAIKYEAYSPPIQNYFPSVLLTPADFEMGGYTGSSTSWNALGDWVFKLNEGKDELLPETISELNYLVRDCKSDREKIAVLYDYLQGRVRYVNLKIGLGGFQPIEASTVHRLAYGDCKALTNYMKAMLKAVGIKSYYCLVKAGDDAPEIIPDFPSMQFNHVILCAPLEQDTLWLECTSQQYPCGYIGTFTDDRYALLIDGTKSHLVRTEKYQPEGNLELCKAGIFLNEDGSGSACISRQFSGIEYNEVLTRSMADDTDKKKIISDDIIFPSFQLVDFKYEDERGPEPSLTETININFENYLTSINNKFILTLNCTNRMSNSLTGSRGRKADIVNSEGSTEIDSLVYQLPAALKIESLPDPVVLNSPFGTYRSEVITGEDYLIYIRKLRINKGTYPAASYAEFVEFIDQILVADEGKCVFIKN
ncbi:MAG: DUF3857 domain-containing protein, partial [Bacteroidales bacterium]|nr:DUF3857 domain-containing protein [Bacteroidales bacterium]